jgi:hypothetical protein
LGREASALFADLPRVLSFVALKGHGLFSKLDRLWLWGGESDHKQATIDIVNLGVGTENGT